MLDRVNRSAKHKNRPQTITVAMCPTCDFRLQLSGTCKDITAKQMEELLDHLVDRHDDFNKVKGSARCKSKDISLRKVPCEPDRPVPNVTIAGMYQQVCSIASSKQQQ